MTMKYSASTRGFYSADIHGETIPSDAVDVSDADYVALFAAQSEGHSIQPGPGGAPISVAPPAPTIADQAIAAINAGCQIVSTGTPALNGTYACDAESRADIMAEMISLLANSAFTNGTSSIVWTDASGTPHTFTVVTFRPFATALGAYVGALKTIIASGAGSLPAQPVTIA
jgi:hypothetical protein